MDHRCEDGHKQGLSESSDISAFSRDSSSTIVASPISAFQFRPGYRRVASVQEEDIPNDLMGPPQFEVNRNSQNSTAHGLGIENVGITKGLSIPPVSRAASKTSKSSLSDTTASKDALLSPDSARLWKEVQGPEGHFEDDREGFPYDGSTPSLYQPYTADSETANFPGKVPSATWQSVGPEPSIPGNEPICKTKRGIYHKRTNWLPISIMVLAIYSTVFSGVWLLIAAVKPRFGQRITSNGRLPPASASLLFTFFAKSIELSFVTVFVAFVGQSLSRRAFQEEGRGITIAEMSMRQWIMQPGTMITHFETVRYAVVTRLGIIALIAALMAMFYTTASDALVSPKLKYGNLEDHILFGKVATSFANTFYIKDACQTPISQIADPDSSGETCMAIEHSGQAYNNYLHYLAQWKDSIDKGNGSSDLAKRIPPVAMFTNNTIIRGSWINLQASNMTDLSAIHKRTVNNVSLAMPHPGVVAAAQDPINNIIQPQELGGQGEYHVQASVPSPAVNVLCASMSHEDLVPMVYTEWPYFKQNHTAPNGTTWPIMSADPNLVPVQPSWLNSTPVDDLFGFGEKYGRRHPVFPKYPKPYNTLTNVSIINADSIYILGTAADGSNYIMCSLRASISPSCSTDYYASMSGGFLNTRCDDPADRLAYSNSMPNATSGVYNTDWKNVASVWASALSLNSGIDDGAASNARLLTQLIPTGPKLDTSLPSTAEALAVLAGNNLLLSAVNSPFIHWWNYSTTVDTLPDPQYQAFNATIRTQDYASGSTQRWQGIFYAVLVLVFLSNVFCLGWLILHGGLVTDFLEPQNLFSLSLNSPASTALDGSCGGGPEGEQFRTKWYIDLDGPRDHIFIKNKGDAMKLRRRNTDRRPFGLEMETSPIAHMYHKLSRKRSSLL